MEYFRMAAIALILAAQELAPDSAPAKCNELMLKAIELFDRLSPDELEALLGKHFNSPYAEERKRRN